MGCFFQIPFLKCLVSTSTPVPCVCNCEPKILIPSEGNPCNNILYLLKILFKIFKKKHQYTNKNSPQHYIVVNNIHAKEIYVDLEVLPFYLYRLNPTPLFQHHVVLILVLQ